MKLSKKMCFIFTLAFLSGLVSALPPMEKIDLNYQDISIRSALQYLARFSEKNIVVSHAVRGRMSIHLKQVNWQEALDIILLTQHLKKQKENNILLIEPIRDAQAEQNLAQAKENTAALKITVLPLKYARASDIKKIITESHTALFSARGSLLSDTRTNSIIINDILTRTQLLTELIKQLDTPIKQIKISARLVNIDRHFERELGLKWHMSRLPNDNKNTTSNQQINIVSSDPLSQLNMALPTPSPGSLGLLVLKLAKGTLLDLEIAALQAEGHAEMISRPELIATNQQPAIIQSGQEIPYQEKTYSGATSIAFKKAVLSLKVTPQIVLGGKILLHLQVTQDHPSDEEVLGVPTIDTRQISTQILVPDKETIVLGGIYEETKNDEVRRVPFLSKLPLMGNLFRYKKTSRTKRELMIFITPSILEG